MPLSQQIRDFATNIFKPSKKSPQEQTTPEAMKELVDRAEALDRLVNEPGWKSVVAYMVEQVNQEIARATGKPEHPDAQLVHVIRWDAKRDLLDTTLGYVDSIRTSRDELAQQFKQEREDANVR